MNQARSSDVQCAPAPWELCGQGYLFALRLPRDVLEHGSFLPQGVRPPRAGQLAYAMFVDYAGSNVGPYHELLYIPGVLDLGGRRALSISRIFVSTWASVVNGRSNWGIPKDRCDFDVRYGADGIDRVALRAADGAAKGSVFAELELQARGPRLPAPGHWVPKKLRTLSQLHDGKLYAYAPLARGHFRFARVRRWRFDARHFPDLASGEVVAALKITDFRMTFPVAQIKPAAGAHPAPGMMG
jgi:hypothetical protein